MNQILSVNMPNKSTNTKRREGNKASIKSIIVFFSIMILIFGISITILGIYGNSKANSNNGIIKKEDNKPIINITQTNENILNIEIKSDINLKEVKYKWSSDDNTYLVQDNSKEFEIQIPHGTETLKVTVTNENDEQTVLEGEYTNKSPIIDLKKIDDEYVIKCENQIQIQSIAYYFDNEEPVTKDNINSYEAEVPINLKEGKHKLTIKVTDINGKVSEQTNDTIMPEITITRENDKLMMKIECSEGISKIAIYFNNEREIKDINDTLYTQTFEMKDGENTLGVIVYDNNNGMIKKGVREYKN